MPCARGLYAVIDEIRKRVLPLLVICANRDRRLVMRGHRGLRSSPPGEHSARDRACYGAPFGRCCGVLCAVVFWLICCGKYRRNIFLRNLVVSVTVERANYGSTFQ